MTEEGVGSGNSTALIVNVAADAAPAAIEWIQKSQLAVGTIVTATPSAGTGPRAVPTPVAANTLAVAVRDLARRHANAESLHLFLIGPLGLAVLMGHHWNRVTTTHVYEHLGGPDYVHAFTVDA
ncbi:SAVED domain-containing protein [Mycolicibacterium psychrotolerans]|uniref:SAVED domain-containing protein n=1 Tax=Mycolicibacterium psychrotolerans TaxID=216929 RepID=UPI003D6760C9